MHASYIIGPGLANWNYGESERWALVNAKGEKCVVFLSDRLQVKWVTKNEDKQPVVYISFRTEQAGLHFLENMYHCKIVMDKTEEILSIDHR